MYILINRIFLTFFNLLTVNKASSTLLAQLYNNVNLYIFTNKFYFINNYF